MKPRTAILGVLVALLVVMAGCSGAPGDGAANNSTTGDGVGMGTETTEEPMDTTEEETTEEETTEEETTEEETGTENGTSTGTENGTSTGTENGTSTGNETTETTADA